MPTTRPIASDPSTASFEWRGQNQPDRALCRRLGIRVIPSGIGSCGPHYGRPRRVAVPQLPPAAVGAATARRASAVLPILPRCKPETGKIGYFAWGAAGRPPEPVAGGAGAAGPGPG